MTAPDAAIDAGGATGICQDRDGDRLTLTGYRALDGQQRVTGLRDTTLGVPCSYRQIDGKWYCTVFHPTFYRDSDCTDPVGHTPSDTLPRYHVIDSPACDIEETHEVYEVGDDLPLTDTYYLKSPACVPVTNPSGHIYELGAKVDPSVAYVSATLTTVGSGRVKAQRFDGSDGSQRCFWAYDDRLFMDTELDTPCSPMVDATDTLRCAPSSINAYVTEAATDPDCSALTPVAQTFCVPNARFSRRPIADDATCPPSQEAVALGDPITVYGDGSGMCTELSGTYRALGDVVPSESLVALTTEWVGSGRLQQLVYEAPGGARAFSPTWRDTQLGTECYPSTTSDADRVICQPNSLPVTTAYIDAGCTTQRQLAVVDADDCDTHSFVVLNDGTVHEVGAVFSDPVYTGSPGSCSVIDRPDATYYEIGAVVDGLAEFTRF